MGLGYRRNNCQTQRSSPPHCYGGERESSILNVETSKEDWLMWVCVQHTEELHQQQAVSIRIRVQLTLRGFRGGREDLLCTLLTPHQASTPSSSQSAEESPKMNRIIPRLSWGLAASVVSLKSSPVHLGPSFPTILGYHMSLAFSPPFSTHPSLQSLSWMDTLSIHPSPAVS